MTLDKLVYTNAEVCEIFEICDNTLRERRKKGWIRPIDTFGGPLRYHRDEILRILGTLGSKGVQS